MLISQTADGSVVTVGPGLIHFLLSAMSQWWSAGCYGGHPVEVDFIRQKNYHFKTWLHLSLRTS